MMKKILIFTLLLTLLAACEKDSGYVYVDKPFYLNEPIIKNGTIYLSWTELGISRFGGSYKIYLVMRNYDGNVNSFATLMATITDRKITSYTIQDLNEFYSMSEEYRNFSIYIISGDNVKTNYQSLLYYNGEIYTVES